MIPKMALRGGEGAERGPSRAPRGCCGHQEQGDIAGGGWGGQCQPCCFSAARGEGEGRWKARGWQTQPGLHGSPSAASKFCREEAAPLRVPGGGCAAQRAPARVFLHVLGGSVGHGWTLREMGFAAPLVPVLSIIQGMEPLWKGRAGRTKISRAHLEFHGAPAGFSREGKAFPWSGARGQRVGGV